MRFLVPVLALLLPIGHVAGAQTQTQTQAQPQTQPPPPAAPPSFAADPVINADRSVTFHFLAPRAAAVTVALEGVKTPIAMTKDEAGTWSYTTAPLKPEVYGYHFEADGNYAVDPRNVWVKTSVLNVGNFFLVPGAAPEPWELTDVPHGTVREHRFTTTVVKGLARDQDNFFVYTPPGYDPHGAVKYPVLYLLHGWSDTADGWSRGGQAGLIMDNLIAAGKAKPMIVVMPLGYGDMSFVNNGWGVWQDPAQINHNVDLFTQTLLTEVLPQVEKLYSVSTRREDRAIAGLSMGGLEALSVGLNHTKMFDYVGGFSAAVHQLKADGLTGLDPKTADLKLLWIACGTEDGLITANRNLITLLKSDGLPVTPIETPGMHVWMVWRDNLVHFAPLLFQGNS
jgi:enterochelin esterase-like enzyme